MKAKGTIVALALALAAAQITPARNVIVEWGTHNAPAEFTIDQYQGNDIGVIIWSNPNPEELWKFAAYDDSDPNQPPGYINYIRIADGVVVDDIHLSVIGDLGHVPPHVYGAADLKSLDLSAHGAETNTINTIHISGDFGELGPMQAYGAGTLVIEGAARGAIDIYGDVAGPVTITELLADIICYSMGDLTVIGPSQAENPAPNITIWGPYLSPHKMDIKARLGKLDVNGTLSGEVLVSLSIEELETGPVSGTVSVGSYIDHLFVGEVSGQITTGQELRRAEVMGDISGLIDVGTDLGGTSEPALIVWGNLSGTLLVRNDLFPNTISYTYIHGWITDDGQLLILGDAGHSVILDGSLSGYLSVDGNMSVGPVIYTDLDGSLHCGGLGHAHIFVDGNLSGSVDVEEYSFANVQVIGNFAGSIYGKHLYGSLHVDGVMSGSIESVNDLGTAISVGSMEPGATVTAGAEGIPDADFIGSLDVDGGVADGVTLEAWHDWNGPLNVMGFFNGRLHAGNDLLAEVSVGAVGSSAVVDVGRNLGNHFAVADGIAGSITVGGNLESTIDNALGRLTADLRIMGNLTSSGAVLITCPNPAFCCTTGTIRIDGDMSGTIDIPVLCDQAGDLSEGHIIVNGSFAEGGQIHLSAPLTGTAFFACDYDGWDVGDDWDPDAVVVIDNIFDPNSPFRYYGNEPGQRLWHITMCKGDLSGDGSVNFGDINPFILALNDPAGYALAFPGLDGSRIYHGDANCDQAFNFGDINTFVLLVEYHCCMGSDCEPCWDDDDGEPLGPEELAAQLAANIWPELYDDLVFVVGAAIEVQPDDESRAYWEAVYAALTQ